MPRRRPLPCLPRTAHAARSPRPLSPPAPGRPHGQRPQAPMSVRRWPSWGPRGERNRSHVGGGDSPLTPGPRVGAAHSLAWHGVGPRAGGHEAPLRTHGQDTAVGLGPALRSPLRWPATCPVFFPGSLPHDADSGTFSLLCQKPVRKGQEGQVRGSLLSAVTGTDLFILVKKQQKQLCIAFGLTHKLSGPRACLLSFFFCLVTSLPSPPVSLQS